MYFTESGRLLGGRPLDIDCGRSYVTVIPVFGNRTFHRIHNMKLQSRPFTVEIKRARRQLVQNTARSTFSVMDHQPEPDVPSGRGAESSEYSESLRFAAQVFGGADRRASSSSVRGPVQTGTPPAATLSDEPESRSQRILPDLLAAERVEEHAPKPVRKRRSSDKQANRLVNLTEDVVMPTAAWMDTDRFEPEQPRMVEIRQPVSSNTYCWTGFRIRGAGSGCEAGRSTIQGWPAPPEEACPRQASSGRALEGAATPTGLLGPARKQAVTSSKPATKRSGWAGFETCPSPAGHGQYLLGRNRFFCVGRLNRRPGSFRLLDNRTNNLVPFSGTFLLALGFSLGLVL